MSLDRQFIEKRDFPIARRGYEPEAVNAHLAALADEVDGLRRADRGVSIAATASEQVRLIVEAAERSASEIEREAEAEASQIRREARENADRLGAEAESQARDRVAAVSEATESLLGRIGAMEGELSELFESLRQGAGRLIVDLGLVQGGIGDLRTAAHGPEPGESNGAAAEAKGEEATSSNGNGADPAEAKADEASDGEKADGEEKADEAEGEEGGDDEGARLIALNMALNGTPREETERYLADNFKLTDSKDLLDDVYARAAQ